MFLSKVHLELLPQSCNACMLNLRKGCPRQHLGALNVDGKTLAVIFPVVRLRIDPLRLPDLQSRVAYGLGGYVVHGIPPRHQLRLHMAQVHWLR